MVTAPPDRATRADVYQLVQMCVGASPNDARRAAEVWKDGHRSATAEELAAERLHLRGRRVAVERHVDPVGDLDPVCLDLVDREHERRQHEPVAQHVAQARRPVDRRALHLLGVDDVEDQRGDQDFPAHHGVGEAS